MSFPPQLLLTGGGRELASPRRVHLVRGRHQAHAGRGDAEGQVRRDLPHPGESVAEGLLRLLCGVSDTIRNTTAAQA